MCCRHYCHGRWLFPLEQLQQTSFLYAHLLLCIQMERTRLHAPWQWRMLPVARLHAVCQAPRPCPPSWPPMRLEQTLFLTIWVFDVHMTAMPRCQSPVVMEQVDRAPLSTLCMFRWRTWRRNGRPVTICHFYRQPHFPRWQAPLTSPTQTLYLLLAIYDVMP
jgi:hypothetical protein